jgi:hypothetical protein
MRTGIFVAQLPEALAIGEPLPCAEIENDVCICRGMSAAPAFCFAPDNLLSAHRSPLQEKRVIALISPAKLTMQSEDFVRCRYPRGGVNGSLKER